jgi:hypothetical protein
LYENLKEREQQEDGGVDGRITSKRMAKKQCRTLGIGFIWLMTGTNDGSFEHGNEPWSFAQPSNY